MANEFLDDIIGALRQHPKLMRAMAHIGEYMAALYWRNGLHECAITINTRTAVAELTASDKHGLVLDVDYDIADPAFPDNLLAQLP